jgi:hypothetical protein
MIFQNLERGIQLAFLDLQHSPELLVEEDCQGISLSKVNFNAATAGKCHFSQRDK